MRATAILGPAASEEDLQPFRLPNVELLSAPDIEASTAAALIFGGDGTVHRQLSALARHKVPALVVPLGSGNDFAHALGISTPAEALQAWKNFCAGAGNVREIDLGCLRPADTGEPTYFCCVAGVGLDSDANRRANAMPRWLRANGGYLLAAVAAICSFQPGTFNVEMLHATTPRLPIRESGYMVAFANAPTYGHGMRIAPAAVLDDSR
ncbi:MAG TPA: diacylglycerol kinase family protein, partial [Terriglobales bacterium]|nr:diacylglycerol kinase family protein [Terriglobales bacterium]